MTIHAAIQEGLGQTAFWNPLLQKIPRVQVGPFSTKLSLYREVKRQRLCYTFLDLNCQKYYFLKKLNFFWPPEWKLPLILHESKKVVGFMREAQKNACKMLLLFLKDDFFFHTACFFMHTDFLIEFWQL